MTSPADQLGLVGALAYAEPGDVLVVSTEGYLGTAVIGDLMAGMLLNSGAAGLVTDGAVRDTPRHRRRRPAGLLRGREPQFAAAERPRHRWASPSASAASR